MSLNYATYFRKMKFLLVLSFMKSTVLTIINVFSFFLVFKLHKSDLHIIHFFAGHINFVSVDIESYLVLGSISLSLGQLSDVSFFWPVNCISFHI